MNASTRAALTTGVTALSLGVLAVVASVPPESMRTLQVVQRANVTGDLAPAPPGPPAESPSEEDLDSALALIEQLAPIADGRVVTVNLGSSDDPKTVTIAPAGPNADDVALPDGGSADVSGQQAVDDPIANNEASDLIDRIYSISSYWSNYLAMELVPWLINWVPFGYLISDQIYIWYPNVVQPTVASFVYDFLDPVVNDPTNPAVWTDGIAAVTSTAANGIANGIADEVNYIVTFGWFPIPLPPLPNLPLPGLPSASSSASASTAVSTVTVLSETDNDAGKAGTGNVAGEPVDMVDGATTETDGATTDGSTEAGTDAADTGAVGTGTAEGASDAAAEDGPSQRAIGEAVEEPAPDADVSVGESAEESDVESAVEDAAKDAEDANKDAAEVDEQLESLIDSGAAEQSGDDAGNSAEAPDSAPGPGESSADGETSEDGDDSATSDASASEGN